MLSTPPSLQARRLVLVDDLHRDRDMDRRADGDAQEIDIDRLVGDRVERIVARDDADLLAGDVDGGDRRQEAAAMQLQEHVLVRQLDREGGCLSP